MVQEYHDFVREYHLNSEVPLLSLRQIAMPGHKRNLKLIKINIEIT